MSAATTVVMARHATHVKQGAVLVGRQAGVPLGHKGREEARRLAARFRGQAAAAVLSSPLERARETAAAIGEALALEVTLSEALTEIDFGDWTGAAMAELDADPRWRSWNAGREAGCPPGGEPMRAAQARIVAALEGWRERYPDGRVVAVSHGDVIKAALCHLLGLSLDRWASFDVDPASLSTVVLWRGGGKVVALNERPAA